MDTVTQAGAESGRELAIVAEPSRVLSERQLEALPLLLSGVTIRDTAKILGIGESTINHWKRVDEHFIAEYTRLKKEKYEGLIQHTQDRMRTILDTSEPGIAVKAGDSLLRYDSALARANVQVTHTVVLDKLRDVIKAIPATIDAEYTVLADDTNTGV